MVSSKRRSPSRATARLPIGPTPDPAFDPAVPDLHPLEPVPSPWPDAAAPAVNSDAANAQATDPHQLASLAAVQLGSLRSALDQAARFDAALDHRASQLAQRLDQARRFEREFDRRLEAAARSTTILDQAGVALSGLERVVSELRSTGETMTTSFQRQLEAHRAHIESLLAEQREAFAARIAEISDQAARSSEPARAAAAEAESEAARIRARLSCNLRAEADLLSAALERHGAQINARTAIALDDAGQRVAELERAAERAATTAAEHLERCCEHAARALGHDPRQAWLGAEPHTSPAHGSLADLAARAESAARAADEALIRLSVATDRAAQIEARMTAIAEQFGAIEQTETRLTALRDDIEAAASSVRHNLALAQQSEAILEKTVDRARDKAQSLDRAMEQVTDQATSMVQVARDVGGLVIRAETARQALSETIARAESAASPTPAAAHQIDRARVRRAPFGPPRPHEDGENAAAA